MVLLRSIVAGIAFLVGSLILTSCAPTVEIASLTPQSANQSVQVTGKVITIAPMINQAAYELQDKNGNSIWILTRKTLPKVESEVTASGKVKFDSIAEENQELAQVYIEE
jgi:predicted phage gp36 major capsid-like protein